MLFEAKGSSFGFQDSFLFAAFESETRDLMQRRGLVVRRLCGRTDTPATDDPCSTPETGSSSTSTAT